MICEHMQNSRSSRVQAGGWGKAVGRGELRGDKASWCGRRGLAMQGAVPPPPPPQPRQEQCLEHYSRAWGRGGGKERQGAEVAGQCTETTAACPAPLRVCSEVPKGQFIRSLANCPSSGAPGGGLSDAMQCMAVHLPSLPDCEVALRA